MTQQPPSPDPRFEPAVGEVFPPASGYPQPIGEPFANPGAGPYQYPGDQYSVASFQGVPYDAPPPVYGQPPALSQPPAEMLYGYEQAQYPPQAQYPQQGYGQGHDQYTPAAQYPQQAEFPQQAQNPQYPQQGYGQPYDAPPQYGQPPYGQAQYGQARHEDPYSQNVDQPPQQYPQQQAAAPPYYDPQATQGPPGYPQQAQPQYVQPQNAQPQYGQQPQFAQPPYVQPPYVQPPYVQPHHGQQPQYSPPQYSQPQYSPPQYSPPQYGQQPQYSQPPYGQQPQFQPQGTHPGHGVAPGGPGFDQFATPQGWDYDSPGNATPALGFPGQFDQRSGWDVGAALDAAVPGNASAYVDTDVSQLSASMSGGSMMPDDAPRYVPPGSPEDDVPAFGVAGDRPMQYRGPVEKVPGANRALIVAILGFLFPAAGVIGFSMGRRADALAAQTGGRYNGRGTAKAAIVFGALSVAAWLAGIGYYWFVWRKSS